MRYLVTGATGFIGQVVLNTLKKRGHKSIAIVRNRHKASHLIADCCIEVKDIGPDTDWGNTLENLDAIIHAAGRAHVMVETEKNPLETYRKINTFGTKQLTHCAVASQVKKFVLLSSVKAGATSIADNDPTHFKVLEEDDPYSITKLEGEKAVEAIASSSDMRWSVIRSPLVYGENVRGNFATLMNAVANERFLPFASISNRRSLIYVANLADALVHAATDDKLQGIYHVTDGAPVSTPELIRKIAIALDCTPRLFSIPPALLHCVASIFGKGKEIRRLLEDLEFDDSNFRSDGKWVAPFTMDEGLNSTANWYKYKKI